MTSAEGDSEGGARRDAGSGSDATARLIEAFGGIRPTASKVGVPVSTVQGWKARGHIPASREDDLRNAARQHSVTLAEADLQQALAGAAERSEGEERSNSPWTRGVGASAGTSAAASASAAETSAAANSGSDSRSGTSPAASAGSAGASAGPSSGATKDGSGSTSSSGSGGASGSSNGGSGGGTSAPPPKRGGAGAVVAAVIAVIAAFFAVTGPLWSPYVAPQIRPVFERTLAPLMANLFGEPGGQAQLVERVDKLDSRLAELESATARRLERVQARTDERLVTLAQDLDRLRGRLDSLAGKQDEAVTAQELEKRLKQRLDKRLAQRDAAASAARLGSLEDRVAQLAGRVEALAQAMANQAGSAGGDSGNGGGADNARTANMAAVGKLSQQVADLRTRLATVQGRLDKLAEAAVRRESVPAKERVASLAQAQQDLAGRLDKMAGRFGKLDKRLAGLDKRLAGLAQDLDKLKKQRARVRAAERDRYALALAVSRLEAAAATNQPFAGPLASVAALADADSALAQAAAQLESHAKDGVATLPDLRRRFAALDHKILQAAYRDAEAGWLKETWAQLRGLVTVRPTVERLEGDGPAVQVARAEQRLEAGDLAGAVAALEKLGGPAGDTVSAWLADARARLQTDRALDKLHTEAIAALAETTGGGAAAKSGGNGGGAAGEAQ